MKWTCSVCRFFSIIYTICFGMSLWAEPPSSGVHQPTTGPRQPPAACPWSPETDLPYTKAPAGLGHFSVSGSPEKTIPVPHRLIIIDGPPSDGQSHTFEKGMNSVAAAFKDPRNKIRLNYEALVCRGHCEPNIERWESREYGNKLTSSETVGYAMDLKLPVTGAASVSAVLSAFDRAAASASKNEDVTIFVTGHGSKNHFRLPDEAFTVSDMRKALLKLSSKGKVNLIMEQCQSASMFRSIFEYENGLPRRVLPNACGVAASLLSDEGAGPDLRATALEELVTKEGKTLSDISIMDVHLKAQRMERAYTETRIKEKNEWRDLITNSTLSSEIFLYDYFVGLYKTMDPKDLIKEPTPGLLCQFKSKPPASISVHALALLKDKVDRIIPRYQFERHDFERGQNRKSSFEYASTVLTRYEKDIDTLEKDHKDYFENQFVPFVEKVLPTIKREDLAEFGGSVAEYRQITDKLTQLESTTPTNTSKAEREKLNATLKLSMRSVAYDVAYINGSDVAALMRKHDPEGIIQKYLDKFKRYKSLRSEAKDAIYILNEIRYYNAIRMMMERQDWEALNSYLSLVDCEHRPLVARQ